MRAVVFTSLLLAACGGLNVKVENGPEKTDGEEKVTETTSQDPSKVDDPAKTKAEDPAAKKEPVTSEPEETTVAPVVEAEVVAKPGDPVDTRLTLKMAGGQIFGKGTETSPGVYTLTSIIGASTGKYASMTVEVSLTDGFKASGDPLYCYYNDSTCGQSINKCYFKALDRALVLNATEIMMPRADKKELINQGGRPFMSRRMSGSSTCDTDTAAFQVEPSGNYFQGETQRRIFALPFTAQ